MTNNKLHTEAAVISHLLTTFTFVYFYKYDVQGYVQYNCAMAILMHWNKLHKRSQIILGDVLQTAIENYNSIHDATITVEDFQNRLQACKRKCTCN